MRKPFAPSPMLIRLTGAAAFVAVAISGWQLGRLDNHAYGVIGLVLSLGLGGLFGVLEMRFFGPLARYRERDGAGESAGDGLLASLLDPETMLPRFWLFSVRLTEEIRRAERYGRALTICALEPEEFTVYLDETFRGRVGRAVRGFLRSSDFATIDRHGSLLVLFTETTKSGAETAARRLVKTLNELLFEKKPCRWRAGVVFYPEDGVNADDLLKTVDGQLTELRVA
jgi:GGDEF domain-containing protein